MFAIHGLLAVLVIVAGPEPLAVQLSVAPADQISMEARALFEGSLRRRSRRPARCEISAEWLPRPPYVERSATRHLGLAAPIDPQGQTGVIVAQIVDPANAHPRAFCDEDQLAAYAADPREATYGLPLAGLGVYAPTMEQEAYSFPLFDRDYRRAILPVAVITRRWSPDTGGPQGDKPEWQIRVFIHYADLYEKRGAGWTFVSREQLMEGIYVPAPRRR